VQERLRELGATVVAPDRRSPDYLQRFDAGEVEKWAVTIKASVAELMRGDAQRNADARRIRLSCLPPAGTRPGVRLPALRAR